MPDVFDAVNAQTIARCDDLIRPHTRRTPVATINAADFGLDGRPLVIKLEQLQHSGSFKVRGAFANLLSRPIPAAGVVAASGGNHGAAVAYAAMKLGIPEKSSSRLFRRRQRSSASANTAPIW